MNPNQLTRLFEAGEMEREEYQARMWALARELLEEAEEERQNPVASFIERMVNQREAEKLKRRHGEAMIREVFTVLSDLEDFLPGLFLWNADHWDVPLHCFLRTRQEPIFRIRELKTWVRKVDISVEYTEEEENRRVRFLLERDWQGDLQVISREEQE